MPNRRGLSGVSIMPGKIPDGTGGVQKGRQLSPDPMRSVIP
jgi:hypothetical protein